jgi:two-component system OmpR family sensor kinase
VERLGRLSLNRLSVKLGAILLAVLAVALGVVYAAVVPRLESRLVDAKLDELGTAAAALALQLPVNSPFIALETQIELASAQVDARVVVLQRLSDSRVAVYADSNPVSQDLEGDAVALAAVARGDFAEGRVTRDGQELAEAAVPIPASPSFLVLLSARLDDALHSVELVRRSVLIAGGIAFAVSWFAGSMAALRLTRRIRRVETAAERLADGDFGVEIADPGGDEVGQLARTFDRMRERLSEVDRARREFIANASHELRTPLFALAGFLELLADEDLEEGTRRDFLETARGQVARLTRLATDLLDLSRIDAGELGLESEPVDLGETAQALADEFGPLAEASGHRLTAGSAGDVVAVGDAERILQIGRSLVENALRHTPAGTSIELRATVWVDRAELSVHDDGPGIGLDEQERVFDRFYRAEGGAAFGSGIGLAIARELARRMDGTIVLRSQPGDTTFTIALPRARVPAPFPRENALVPSR